MGINNDIPNPQRLRRTSVVSLVTFILTDLTGKRVQTMKL